jgi:hypothetical protein
MFKRLAGMRSKYGNKKTVVDGVTFASQKEAQRYGVLKLLERAKDIIELELQPRYPLVVNGVKVCTYVADFRYRYKTSGQLVVEDVKGMKTPAYKIKKKLLKALTGINVREV